jgi:hypothetical protein
VRERRRGPARRKGKKDGPRINKSYKNLEIQTNRDPIVSRYINQKLCAWKFFQKKNGGDSPAKIYTFAPRRGCLGVASVPSPRNSRLSASSQPRQRATIRGYQHPQAKPPHYITYPENIMKIRGGE